MSETVENIRLFLSCPSDVAAERESVHRVVGQLNRMLGARLGLRLEVVEWRSHVTPELGQRPQEVINRQIGRYDIYLGLMWKRFGTPTGAADSGTEEEFNIAYQNLQQFGKPRILFYFSQVPYMPKNSEEMRQWSQVIAFKERLQQLGLVWDYPSVEAFGDALREHLAGILQDQFQPVQGAAPVVDFTRYLNYLKKDTMYIDIRGLVTGQGKVHQFRIDELYIPLKTTAALARDGWLQEALTEPRLLIKGDPGAGKTTFLRLIAFSLCQKWLGDLSVSAKNTLHWPEPVPLPILVRLGTLTQHLRECRAKGVADLPHQPDSPACLLHFLAAQGQELNWGLDKTVFEHELQAGRCLILLDGLDEAANPVEREQLSALAANLFKAYPKCRIVLTSRPAALVGEAVPVAFQLVEIAPLDDAAMATFLTQWCAALYAQAPYQARSYQAELQAALTARPEIRRMARTPVMLTALAVVHWNEHRLPEQWAELYESILTWLVRARAQRPGRLKADRCRKLLQKLALAMFTHKDGRQRQVGLRWAAEVLAPEFTRDKNLTLVAQAEAFLHDEMLDSGIIVARNHRLEFWHLSFQEYLAAYEIAGLLEPDQNKLLFEHKRLYSGEWRELALLLAGVLYKQGEDKINHLIDAILGTEVERADLPLPALAKKVAILGGMVRDLAPFEFKPSNPDYEAVVRSVMGIFDPALFRQIPVADRIQAADALGQVGDPRLDNDPMVYIPGGRFWMGAQRIKPKERNFDVDARDDESPVHLVQLSPFRIGKYPVTVGQYRRFIDDGGYEQKRFWGAGGFGQFNEPDKWQEQLQYPSRPVVNVSWYEAAAYACWAGGRLPTEAEWERAARGPGADYRKYPWGNNKPDMETTNHYETGIGDPTPVGIFPEDCSPEGVIDLGGNVWEWCQDWYGNAYYVECERRYQQTGEPVLDPIGPGAGEFRVVRGGSWAYNDMNIPHSAVRGLVDPYSRSRSWGFRICLSPE